MHHVKTLRTLRLRITGGQCRGRVITGPEGLEVRPTASKIRQAFFNIISNRIPDARFVDVCAGSGLMGLEALSRGAQSLIAIEDNRKFAQAIEANCQKFGFKEHSEVICGDARKVLPLLNPGEADVIWADPPYKSELAAPILHAVDKNQLLAEDGIFVIEHAVSVPPPESVGSLAKYDSRKYGGTAITFFRTFIFLLFCISVCCACGEQRRQAPPKPAQQQILEDPRMRSEIDESKLWRAQFLPTEQVLLGKVAQGTATKDEVLLLSKLAQVHYNSALASYHQSDLAKQIVHAEEDARAAVDGYEKLKLSHNDPQYPILLRRLALAEEKLGNYSQASEHMEAAISQHSQRPLSDTGLFAMKMDLARIYMQARYDDQAADLLEDLLAQYRKNRKLTDSEIILYENWIKAEERLHFSGPHPRQKEIDQLRALSKKLKFNRAVQLEKEAQHALDEQSKEDKRPN